LGVLSNLNQEALYTYLICATWYTEVGTGRSLYFTGEELTSCF